MSKKDHPQFSGVVCQRLRNLVAARNKAKSEREHTFEERDEASRMIGEALLAKQDTTEHEAAYGRAVMQLEILGQRIKWIDGEIDKTVEGADDAKLFEDADLDMPLFKPKAKHTEKGQEPPERDDPDQAKFGGTTQPEGEDQHLEASVKELELDPAIEKALIKGGYKKVGDIAKVIDAGEDLVVKGLDVEQCAKATAATKKYRKEHRQAGMKREKELAGNFATG